MFRWILLLLIILWPLESFAADNIIVLDGNRTARTLATKDLTGVHTYKMMVTDSTGNIIDFSDHGGIGVTPHEHSGHGNIHMHLLNLTTSTTRYILIDLSDTTNWPHTTGTSIHLEYLDMQVDASNTAAYTIDFIMLDSCSITSCRSGMVWATSGSQSTGNNKEIHINWAQHGPVCKFGTGGVFSDMVTDPDTNYQTDVLLRSTLDPSSATVAPNNGDLIMVVTITAGTITIDTNLAYHTHAVDHP